MFTWFLKLPLVISFVSIVPALSLAGDFERFIDKAEHIAAKASIHSIEAKACARVFERLTKDLEEAASIAMSRKGYKDSLFDSELRFLLSRSYTIVNHARLCTRDVVLAIELATRAAEALLEAAYAAENRGDRYALEAGANLLKELAGKALSDLRSVISDITSCLEKVADVLLKVEERSSKYGFGGLYEELLPARKRVAFMLSRARLLNKLVEDAAEFVEKAASKASDIAGRLKH